MLSPIIQEVAKELNGNTRVLKIDVDKNQRLASKLGIKGVPTMLIYQKGKIMWRQSGVMQKSEIVSKLNQFTQTQATRFLFGIALLLERKLTLYRFNTHFR